ncbi:hypothetical protein GAYE_SCF65G6780 [Galdieria yellowstonensis]|uniref:Uncharacterized protein n=1 Tax=Galdieria yellowstonensis TaxID=3028027 RepID=A0AAV9INH2_9RHOD|nr:hypothetical protein GAYE_SCF65G6780 [Galdieria yellowstonensis]
MEYHRKTLSFSCFTKPVHIPSHNLVLTTRSKIPSRNQRWVKRTRVSWSTAKKKTFDTDGSFEYSSRAPCRQAIVNSLDLKDAMDFFRLREGQWRSWRVTHHLAFRRDEQGFSNIVMKVLDKTDERIIELCRAHQVEPQLAAGGCYVEWEAQMSWDQEGENHQGSTIFAIVPDDEDGCSGKLLRDRGYAEIVQVAGTFRLTDNKELVLHTPYDGGDVEETFAFIDKDTVIRSSTVKRFGGFATATFSTERRENAEKVNGSIVFTEEMLPFGGPSMAPKTDEKNARWRQKRSLSSAFRMEEKEKEEEEETQDHSSAANVKSSSTGALDFL